MAKQDVRHVDLHPTSNESGGLSAPPAEAGLGTSPSPVLVSVPWLAPKVPLRRPSQEEIRAADPAILPTKPFQPQSFVATIGMGVEPLAPDWSVAGTPGSPTQLNQTSAPSPRLSVEPSAVAPQRTGTSSQPRLAPEQAPQSRPSHLTWVGGEGETHLRVDPPQSPTTSQPAVDPPLPTEPSPWQQQLVAIDQFLKANGRLILLGAVMLATVFVLVVLNRGRSSSLDPVDGVIPSPGHRIAPATPQEIDPSRELRPIDPPRVAEALGPEGLAIRENLDSTPPAEADITPIKPHFEGHGAEPTDAAASDEPKDLPYPSTRLPSWEGAANGSTEEAPSNIAVIRSVRPTR